MEELTKQVKQFALDLGMDLIGIASTETLNELTPEGYNRPKDILAECNSNGDERRRSDPLKHRWAP